MKTLQQLEQRMKELSLEISSTQKDIDDLQFDMWIKEKELEKIESMIKQIKSIPDQCLDVVKELIPFVRDLGTGHEQRIVEEAASRELEDFEEIGRVKHLARQFLHITL